MEQTHELLKSLVGSRAYGTFSDSSDYDWRLVFAPDTVDLFKVDSRGSKNHWNEDKDSKVDVTGWELEKFVKLAINCNPTALEVLWSPYLACTPEGAKLVEIRHAFLSRRRVLDAFTGYASNQRNKMLETPSVGWTVRNWKFAEAYIRVLYQAYWLLATGELVVDFTDPVHANLILPVLMEAKRGTMKSGEVITYTREFEERLHGMVLKSKMVDEPNVALINETVIVIRHALWRR